MLSHLLIEVTEPVVVAIDALALVIVVIASLTTFVQILRMWGRQLTGRPVPGHEQRLVWLEYGRWLVAALTFQLAADILESSTAPSWESIAQLGAIAAIRTFLNYFLGRDIGEIRERNARVEHVEAVPVAPADHR